MKNNDLSVYRGRDYIINDFITIHQPTLGEIEMFGEEEYWSTVYSICATPTDMKWQLHLIGEDWNQVSDYELFLMMYRSLTKESTSLIFGDLDFNEYELDINPVNGDMCLIKYKQDESNKESNIKKILFGSKEKKDREIVNVIDRSIYEQIVSYLRTSHKLKKNVERAMTETTRLVLLEEAEENFNMAKNKPYKSQLVNLISTFTTMEGSGYNHNTIWDLKINAFMIALESIQHNKSVDRLLQSGYSGFGVDLSKINKKELNYFGRD